MLLHAKQIDDEKLGIFSQRGRSIGDGGRIILSFLLRGMDEDAWVQCSGCRMGLKRGSMLGWNVRPPFQAWNACVAKKRMPLS